MKMKENGKVLTGCILSALSFIGLLLPSFTVYSVSYSYSYYEETISYSPFAMLGDEDYMFVIIFVLPIIIGLVLNLIFTLTHKNKKINIALVLIPGILIVFNYFCLMIVGFIGALEETYNGSYSTDVGTGTGIWPFFLVAGAFAAHIVLSTVNNKAVGPMVVAGQAITNETPSIEEKTPKNPAQYAAEAQTIRTEQERPATPAGPKTPAPDGKMYGNLVGAQRILDVYEDRIVLTQMKNFRALLTQDLFKGQKEISFTMMSSIQYKPASKMILGYIQFEVPGVVTGNNFGSENSWTFDESLNNIAKEVCDYCKKQVVAAHKPQVAQVVQQTSAADELLKYKQLLDAGVITQEEFDAKKKELLGL